MYGCTYERTNKHMTVENLGVGRISWVRQKTELETFK